MRILLVTAMMTGLAASSALAECGHNTTAQSKAPVVVAQNTVPMTAVPAGAVDETLTGSTVIETLVKQPAAEASSIE
jgi:chemotaxis response regulator CheB